MFLSNCRREIYISTNCQGKRGEKSSQSLRSSFSWFLTHFLTQSPRQAPPISLALCPSTGTIRSYFGAHSCSFQVVPWEVANPWSCVPYGLLQQPPKHPIKWYFWNAFTSHSSKFPHILVLILPVAGRSLSCVGERQPVVFQCLIGRFVTEFPWWLIGSLLRSLLIHFAYA